MYLWVWIPKDSNRIFKRTILVLRRLFMWNKCFQLFLILGWCFYGYHTILLSKCARSLAVMIFTISWSSLFYVFILLRFLFQFLDYLLVVMFNCCFTFSIFVLKLPYWRSVNWASHSFVFFNYSCLMNLSLWISIT